mmetsp:Transcript_7337/g.23044  ORF Transcript_7337/g.23044 Transcript_7337/m.23044 type:complete len:325 (-) Transcript_7337:60-1034(-)
MPRTKQAGSHRTGGANIPRAAETMRQPTPTVPRRLQITRYPRARTDGRLGIPAEVIAHALAFGDLPLHGAAACASTELRDGHARLPPEHARRLVIRRFPILRTVDCSTMSARELFFGQKRVWNVPLFPPPPESRPLDSYTFSLELIFVFGKQYGEMNREPEDFQSMHIGRGTVAETPRGTAQLKFDEIPAGLFSQACRMSDNEDAFPTAKIMASRRGPAGTVEFAHLYDCTMDVMGVGDDEVYNISFEWLSIHHQGNAAINVHERRENAQLDTPTLGLAWCRADDPDGPSRLEADFDWTRSDLESAPLSVEDLRHVLEHLVDWI